jgi:hypothetical protein
VFKIEGLNVAIMEWLRYQEVKRFLRAVIPPLERCRYRPIYEAALDRCPIADLAAQCVERCIKKVHGLGKRRENLPKPIIR